MNPVVRKEDAAVAVSETTAIVSMIERAARDPNVDIDKMERLLAMQERVLSRGAEQEFNNAMAVAQAEMRPVAADSNNPQTRSRYASYFALDKALREIYTKHGFALSFNTSEGAAESYVRVVCVVSHRAGHSRTYHVDMPADGKGAKGGDVMTKTHATGAAVSYGSRYLLKMIFNVAIGEDDDDGNSATNVAKLTGDQVGTLRTLIVESGADIQRFLAFMGVSRLEDISASQFKRAATALEAKRGRK